MTLEEAQIHLEYIKANKPTFFTENGIPENIISDKELISEAAEIATQTHWGAINVSEEDLFDKTLVKLIQKKQKDL